jgi:hypothetical protein
MRSAPFHVQTSFSALSCRCCQRRQQQGTHIFRLSLYYYRIFGTAPSLPPLLAGVNQMNPRQSLAAQLIQSPHHCTVLIPLHTHQWLSALL